MPIDRSLLVQAFLFIELLADTGSILTLVTLMRVRDRTPEVDRRLAGKAKRDIEPIVDVLICTYNEEEEILERTIAGALTMDYSRHRVWVLDNGHRDWLQELASR